MECDSDIDSVYILITICKVLKLQDVSTLNAYINNMSHEVLNSPAYYTFPNHSDVTEMVRKFCGSYDKKVFQDETEYLFYKISKLDRACLDELNNTEHSTLFEETLTFLSKEEKLKKKLHGYDEPGHPNYITGLWQPLDYRQNQLLKNLRPIDVIILCNNTSHFENIFKEYLEEIECENSIKDHQNSDILKESRFYEKFGLALIPKKDDTEESSGLSIIDGILKYFTLR